MLTSSNTVLPRQTTNRTVEGTNVRNTFGDKPLNNYTYSAKMKIKILEQGH